MKYLLSVLALLLLGGNMNAQPLAVNSKAIDDDLTYSSLANYHHHRRPPKPKPMVVAGICITSVGVGLAAVGGFAIALGEGTFDDPVRRTELEVVGAGAVIAAIGAVILIEAFPHHHARGNWYGLNVIAPKMNEVGLAYNF